jgi:hypothetical protein
VAQIVFRSAVAGPADGRRAGCYYRELYRQTASPTDTALQRSVNRQITPSNWSRSRPGYGPNPPIGR